MGATPQFSSTVLVGHATPSATADAVYGASQPAHAVTLLTAGASGTKVEQIECVGTGVTVAGNITVWIFDGTTYWLIYTFLVTVVTPSTTVSPFYASAAFNNLVIPTGSTLAISSAVASQLVNVNAYGGSF